MITLQINHLKYISEIAKQFINLTKGYKKFAFYGKMGVGKTTFIIALCKELGAVDIVNSPTFTMINEYLTDAGTPIYHLDFFRIKSVEELFDIGFEDYLYEDVYCFIEWPEKGEEILSDDIVKVFIEEIDKNKRQLKIHI